MHEGHRNRLVSKVKGGGIVYAHELMEILLFNACPRRDLNATAHALFDRFDTIEGVLQSDCRDLEKVKGVGENMAEYIAVLGLALRAVRETDAFALAGNVREFKKFVLTRPVPEYDCLELHCIDKDGRVRRIITFKGSEGLRAAPGEPEMLKLVSAHRPYGIFAAYRRASGNSNPSALDDGLSESIGRVSRLCGARYYDYSVVDCGGGYYSYKMADRGDYFAKGSGDTYGDAYGE